MNEIIEHIANFCHEQWMGWMSYMFSKCTILNNGDMVIPKNYVDRWKRQIDTIYANLPENEKESDRIEARKFVEMMGITVIDDES